MVLIWSKWMIGICGIVQKGGLAAPERSDDNKKGIVVEKAKSGRRKCQNSTLF